MKFLLEVCASSRALRTLLADLGHDVLSASDVDPRASDDALLAPLNLSHFVARQIWRRRGVAPLRCRTHRLQRREPPQCLLVPMDTIFDLLQTAIN